MSLRARSRSARDFVTILLVSVVVLVPAMARVYQRATVQNTRTHEGSTFSHSSDSAPTKTTNVSGLALVWEVAVRPVDVTVGQRDTVNSPTERLPFLFVNAVHSLRAPPIPRAA
jgi:hypothetical protein